MSKRITVFGLVLIAACGGSALDLGVPGNKPLNQLSATDLQTLCERESAYVNTQLKSATTKEQTCRAVGAALASFGGGASGSDAQLQAACAAGYAACEALPADAGVGAGVDAGAGNGCPSVSNCTATVNQYSACVNETLASFQNALPPCNQLTKATLQMIAAKADAGVAAAGAACMAFAAACPGVNISQKVSALMMSGG